MATQDDAMGYELMPFGAHIHAFNGRTFFIFFRQHN